MIGNYRDVIIAPIITEKTAQISEKGDKIVLKVRNDANKVQIKQAVEKIFNVKVLRVNTINVKPKYRRVGRYAGTTSRYKKAIVTLAEGSQIEL